MPLAIKCSEKENISKSKCNCAIACKCLGTSGQITCFSEPLNSFHCFTESLTSMYAFNHAEKSHINLGAPENIVWAELPTFLHTTAQIYRELHSKCCMQFCLLHLIKDIIHFQCISYIGNTSVDLDIYIGEVKNI